MKREFPDLDRYVAKYGEKDGWFMCMLAVDLFYWGTDEWFERWGA